MAEEGPKKSTDSDAGAFLKVMPPEQLVETLGEVVRRIQEEPAEDWPDDPRKV